MARLALTARLAVALVFASIVAAPAAEATWPGQNGRIYFSCRAVGGSFDSIDICAINPDGSGLVNLTNTPAEPESTPSVSRDGRQISFIRGSSATARLWVANADGSGARQVTNVQSDGSAWAPDGLQLAFRSRVGDTFEFELAPAIGGATTLLPGPASMRPVTGSHQGPKYNAAGAYLYSRFAEIPGSPGSFTEQVFVVRDGGEVRATPFTGNSSNSFPSWTPDGGRVLYNRLVSGDFEIFATSSAGGGSETNLTNTPTLGESWGSLSPDGAKLIYQRDDAGFSQEILVVANADGSGATPIPTPTLAAARFPVWAPVAGSGGTTPTPQPKPKPALTVGVPAKKLAVGKALTLTLGCNAPTACVISYGASVSVPAIVKASKVFKVKSKKVRVPTGKTKKVKVKLPTKARKAADKALKAGRKLTLNVVITARKPNGKKIKTAKIKIKLKR